MNVLMFLSMQTVSETKLKTAHRDLLAKPNSHIKKTPRPTPQAETNSILKQI